MKVYVKTQNIKRVVEPGTSDPARISVIWAPVLYTHTSLHSSVPVKLNIFLVQNNENFALVVAYLAADFRLARLHHHLDVTQHHHFHSQYLCIVSLSNNQLNYSGLHTTPLDSVIYTLIQ